MGTEPFKCSFITDIYYTHVTPEIFFITCISIAAEFGPGHSFFPAKQDKMQWWRCLWQEKKPFKVVAVATEGGDPYTNGDYWTTSYRLEFGFDENYFEPYKEEGKIRVCHCSVSSLFRCWMICFA